MKLQRGVRGYLVKEAAFPDGGRQVPGQRVVFPGSWYLSTEFSRFVW